MRSVRIVRLMVLAAVLWPSGPARAQNPARPAPQAASTAVDTAFQLTTIPLWSGGAPGAHGTSSVDIPQLVVFPPQPGTSNGTAVIIAPGGAYLGLAANLEGRQVADWFAARGVTAFVLRYRLGSRYLYPVPLQDARRAVRLVRTRAAEFAIAPDRIGMMGFSAGGHLAAATGTIPDSGVAGALDSIDRVDSRPDFLILAYPWLNAMRPGQSGLSYCGVMHLTPERCATFAKYSPEQYVTARTPPTFIFHTTDDAVVPVDASVTFYRALAAANVPVEMHIFASGHHGVGLGEGDPALDLWPPLLEAWLRGRGLLTRRP